MERRPENIIPEGEQMHYISFPNLGIDPFRVTQNALEFGNFRITWYGVIITLGIILAVVCVLYRRKQEGISTDDILDYAIFSIFSAIIGARAYYVLTTLDTGNYKSFYDVIAIWEGGLAIYGGLIGGILAILIVSCVKKIDCRKILDMAAPGVLLGQAIGRWGNFVNAEAYGTLKEFDFLGHVVQTPNAADLPWVMGIQSTATSAPLYVHPTFLYESLWTLMGFILLSLYYKHKKFNGQIVLMYAVWYGLGRMFIEGFRTDSLYVGNVRISQLLALACVVFGTILLIVGRRFAKTHPLKREMQAVPQAAEGPEKCTCDDLKAADAADCPVCASEAESSAVPAASAEEGTEADTAQQSVEQTYTEHSENQTEDEKWRRTEDTATDDAEAEATKEEKEN